MKKFLYYVMAPASPAIVQMSLSLMRIGIGLLTIGHGLPKLTGGIASWKFLGSAMSNFGINFLPEVWGFLAASTEVFGGIALILGLATRIVVLPLIFMMFVAFKMHMHNGDPFNVYSFPLTLIVVFGSFFFIGGGALSLDNLLTYKKQ